MKTKHCPHCGSDNLVIDAFASWNPALEEWELHSTYDDVVCNDCGENFDRDGIVERELNPEEAV